MRLPPVRTIALLLPVALTGCWVRAAGGPGISLNRGTPAGAINAELGFSSGVAATDVTEPGEKAIPIAAVRTRIGADASEAAIAIGGVRCAGSRTVRPCFLFGVNALQFGVVDGKGSFGMLGPWIEVPVAFRLGDGIAFVVGPGAEYAFRFTTRSEGFATINAGFVLSTLFAK